MAKSSVGIYISAKYVDIAALRGSLKAPEMIDFIREEIPILSPKESKGGEQNKEGSWHDCLSLAIKTGLEKLKIQKTGVYTVLPASDAMIRYFSMPQLPQSERDQAVSFEARKYIPYNIDEIVSGFKILPLPKGKKALEVFFVAVTKKQFNSHLELFKKANSNAVGVDIVLFALIRVLLLEKKIQAKENVAVLHIDNDKKSASIHAVNKGMPFLSRDFKISIDDQEALFEKLASELRVSLGYYHRQNPQGEISKVIVCGESLFTGLDTFISEELKIITETLERPKAVRGADKFPLSALAAIGTALGGLGSSPYSINLSPVALAVKKERLTRILLAEFAIALFMILTTFLINNNLLTNMLDRVKAVKERGAEITAETSDMALESLSVLKDKKLDEVEFLWQLVNKRVSWAQKLDVVAKVIPEGIWIRELNAYSESTEQKKPGYSSDWKRTFYITGYSFSLDTNKELDYVTDFFSSLKKDPDFMHGFDDITLRSMDKEEVEGYRITSFKIFAASAEEPPLRKGERIWHRE